MPTTIEAPPAAPPPAREAAPRNGAAPAREQLDTHEKALRINLDQKKYGTFAEIGAGQEVARWFFRVGGASGTVAKTISAYDMTVSDAIYGPADRYVSRQRLQTMLDHEYSLLFERLAAKRGATTQFFAFANTVAAQSFNRRDDCHGWMGIRFQPRPGEEPSQIIIHVRMLDRENLPQQEALGIMGVNLIYGALNLHASPDRFLESLLDGLSRERVELDMIKFSGPAFQMLDNRLASLQLVQLGLTDSAMFTADGEVVQAAELLHKKSVLVARGSFRPVTHVTLDMLNSAQARFAQETGVAAGDLLVLLEMTLRNLSDSGAIDYQDFLERVDLLGALGKTVLISNYGAHHRLAAHLFRYTRKKCAFVLGVPTLREIFDDKYYTDLDGGILESFGRLFKNDLKLYVYPLREPATGALITGDNLVVPAHLRHLLAYLVENRCVEPIRPGNEEYLRIFSREVLALLRAGDPRWETMVPPTVANAIKRRKLLGYTGG
jgi:hypothetical protein